MGRLLLVGHPGASWRGWLKENRGARDLLCLDPADPDSGSLARFVLLKGEKPVRTRFYGSLDPSRAPHVTIAALAEMLPHAAADALVLLPAFRGGPLMRHVAVLAAQLVAPEEILVAKGSGFGFEGLPIGPHEVELEASFPEAVRHAQRKAQWLKLLEGCTEHEVDLRRVAVEGARLGSGHQVPREQLKKLGLEDVVHAEVAGGTLLLIAEEEPDEGRMTRALDVFHCGRAHVVSPGAYNGLLCSFARQDGEDFGTGVVQCVDFESGVARVLNDAVAPAPVRILRLGGLRIDTAGREMGEARPWQV